MLKLSKSFAVLTGSAKENDGVQAAKSPPPENRVMGGRFWREADELLLVSCDATNQITHVAKPILRQKGFGRIGPTAALAVNNNFPLL